MPATHEVTNQAPPLQGHDVAAYRPLLDGVRANGAGWAEDALHELGTLAGSAQAQEWGRVAEKVPPVLHTHDRYGHRIDEVEYHPYYHELMGVSVRNGLHAAPWREEKPGAHVARSAKMFVWCQADAGHLCPISMTYAAIPALRTEPELARSYEPLLTNPVYEPELRAPLEKSALIAGMSMTEKQGGSDVRANTTKAVPNADGSFALTGHKWFTSAPNSDVFLTLAVAPGGLSCFLVPKILPDGSRNTVHLQRLKDKLGNKSNASSEIEYDNALGWPIGEQGRGVATIIKMVNMTRLDCLTCSASAMRLGLSQALHHARYRSAFGGLLIDAPLMRNVLADLAIEAEAATLVTMRLAGAVDRAGADEHEAALRRIGIAISKYWVCKRAPVHAGEALECLGGNGYVEESGMPRLYREAPLTSIWEGSGNVAALDALRAMARQPATVEAYFAEVDKASGVDARLDDAIAVLRKELSDFEDVEYRARRVVELMALVLQGAELHRTGDAAVADAFCATRLGGDWGGAFGTLPSAANTDAILSRATI
ncbi:acyl-CoA dehydrogenase family protein [Sciscionella marina]|uniref:acyl-CoA dehydrogenase family protein n=1 Tax=Sciscionella marina TaxID=508770 RepID=UPI00037B3F39|nr:acyl-CoA dehydrogenase family protein [Sciscionella marina]